MSKRQRTRSTPGPKPRNLPGDPNRRKVTIYLTSEALADRVREHPGARTMAEFGEKAFSDALAKADGQ